MDPLSLIAVGYSLVTTDLAQGENSVTRKLLGKVFESAVYGPLGNYTYDKLKDIYAHLQKGDSENLNHDLQLAARKAQLTATLLAVRACLAETRRLNANGQSLWSKASGLIRKEENEQWLNEVADLWQQKIKSLSEEDPLQIVKEDQVISLFDPKQNLALTDTQKQLVNKLKEDALTEIRTEYYPASFSNNAYKLLEEAIRTGWNETKDGKSSDDAPGLYPLGLKQALINTDKQYDWFSLVCGLFNEEYKNNTRVEAAMQKYLLLDIRDRQTGVQLDPKTVADLLAGHLQQFGDSFVRLEALLTTIDAKQDEILGFVKKFIEENRGLHKITHDKLDYVIKLLEDEKALPPEKREAIQEANRQEYHREIELEHTPSEVVGSFFAKDKFFVDRDTERESLKNRLLAGEKMIVVKAFSGYGKTSLMTEVLHGVAPDEQLKHEKVRGILLFYCRDNKQVSLREVCRKADARLRKAGKESSFTQAYDAFKRETRENPAILPTELIDRLIDDLSALGDIWLVFDNFETALEGASVRDAELREFFVRALPTAKRLRFLVTSQKIPQLDGVKPLEIGDLPPEFAKEYLHRKGAELKEDGIDCGLAEAGDKVLEDLLRETTAVPMRLVSFVGYLREAYLKHAKVLADALADENVMKAFREHDEKKGSMSLLEKQYLLLNDTEQLILKALSIFPQAVPFAVLKSVLPLTLDEDAVLNCLTSSSFVRRLSFSYELLTLPKEVITKRAEGPDDPFSRCELHTRAAAFYASIHKPEQEWKTIEDFAPQFAEMYHSRQAGLCARAANVLGKEDGEFLGRAGYSRRAVDERKELVGKPIDEGSKAYNSGCLANAYSDLGEKRTAIKYHNEALEAYRRLKDKRNEAIVLGNIGNAYSDLGKKRKAIDEYYTPALEIHRAVGNRVSEGRVLGNIGNAYSDLGEKRKALEYYEDALKVHREVGDRVGEGRVLGFEGVTKFELGEKEEGMRLVEQALEIARQVEDKMFEDWLLKKLEAMKGR